ncbi:peptidoglycan hydrolase-like protein with peptidoglycan-binding domain [Streptomyces sp. B3I7]|uniref:L,D-transpeptidase family protein n=1 Tax=Streptomyces sp. B3I7 TaxID=3042269 RepID=UPI002788542F|nr:L,D-transpeptidase family protein [Streptomyces sp. B3I7]MDQ0811627.1 peptidoglycan hydrolase-like protein with peptidoglycan-binding domain [Streptomyces sp. B3I7]
MLAAGGALVVIAAVGGCTVQPTDGDGRGGGTYPVHIDVPATRGTGTPATHGTGTPAGRGAGKAAPPAAVPRATSAPRTVAPARVLWSDGDHGRGVRELQARLKQAAWLFDGPTGTYDDLTAKAVGGFQGKRGLPRTGRTDTVTWQRLLAMTHEPTKWELYAFGGQPAAPPDPRCLTGRVLCISKTSRTLRWMIDGRTVSEMPVRFGTELTPTREGVFHVYWKSRHHVSTLYDSPMPYAMFFSGGQAVHYSYDFAARGYAGGSHGCVNVRDEQKIAALFAQVRDGDKVVVHW